MKVVTLIAAALIVLSCGEPWAPQVISPELAERIEDFENQTGHEVFSSVVTYKPEPAGFFDASELGKCVSRKGERPVIHISDTLEPPALTAVLWHEIGHCDYGLPHTEPVYTVLPDTRPGALLPVLIVPNSIMVPDLTLVSIAFEAGYSSLYLCAFIDC